MTEQPSVATPAVDDNAPAADDGPTQLDLEKVRRYQELRAAQKGLESEADAIKAEANKLEAELIEAFADAGLQNMNVNDHTVYLHRSTFATRCEGVTADDVKAALRAAGAGDLVTETVNAQTLSAYVRELVDVDDAPGLPEPLKDVLDLGERFALRVRSAPKPKRRAAAKG